jgi:thiamine biosynthesis lipoprotein
VTSLPDVSVRPMWGTMISVDVRDAIDRRAIEACWAWFQRVDDVFSTWRDDSEISRLGRGELALANTSPEVAVVLEFCDQIKRTSGGAFDVAFAARSDVPRRPGWCAIDPTGVVKGWAVDRAGALLRSAGATNFAINAGGDVLACGQPEPGAAWRVGIQHPWQRNKTVAIVAVSDRAVATSGDYERGDHVYDARTGRPASGLVSVTVIGPALASADGYATAALALGHGGMEWLATLPEVVAMGITGDRRVVKTAGFDGSRSTTSSRGRPRV